MEQNNSSTSLRDLNAWGLVGVNTLLIYSYATSVKTLITLILLAEESATMKEISFDYASWFIDPEEIEYR